MKASSVDAVSRCRNEDAMQKLRLVLRERGLGICISGIDGSGKTTLARDLVLLLETAGVPVRHLHFYRWYVNLTVTPFLLLYNRYIGRRVLLFDRTFFDNLAVLRLSRRCPDWVLRCFFQAALVIYPDFDVRFYLYTDLDETLRRRPETTERHFTQLRSIYDEITSAAGHQRLISNELLLGTVLRILGQLTPHGAVNADNR